MNLIVAVDKNWAIGCNNDLLVSIPADKKFFRTETTGKVIILGRKTLETFPGGKPLPKRTNIIITANPDYEKDGCALTEILSSGISDSELVLSIKKRTGAFSGRPDNGHDIRSNSIPFIQGINPVTDITVRIKGKIPKRITLLGSEIEFTRDGSDACFTVEAVLRERDLDFIIGF